MLRDAWIVFNNFGSCHKNKNQSFDYILNVEKVLKKMEQEKQEIVSFFSCDKYEL